MMINSKVLMLWCLNKFKILVMEILYTFKDTKLFKKKVEFNYQEDD